MFRDFVGRFKSTCKLTIGLDLLIKKTQKLSINFIEKFVVCSWFHTHISYNVSVKNGCDYETTDTIQETKSLNGYSLFEVSKGTDFDFLQEGHHRFILLNDKFHIEVSKAWAV